MPCRLYLITPPKLEPRVFADELKRALGAGDVASLQLRLKDVSDDEIKRAVDTLKPIAQSHGVAFLMNDRPDLARAFDCDGVHVGQDDASYDEARSIVGMDRIVGVTCHDSRELAFQAGEAGADYVAFGAFFPTETKEPKTRAEIELIESWAESMTVPCVAIGGITVENCAPLIAAGADFIAVSAGVWKYKDGPAAAVKAFNAMFGGRAMKARKRQAGGKIVIGDDELTWELLREAHYSTEGYKGMVFSVRAEGERTFRELQIQFPYPKQKPGFHQDKERIDARTVEKAIRLAMDMGFNPTSRGRTFILELDHGDLD